MSLAGTIESVAPDANTPFEPRQLSVNYLDGQGGVIRLNTHLGDDSSPSDRIVIKSGGAAIGNINLEINDVGGLGAQTMKSGILVVEAQNNATTDDANFAPVKPVYAGAYQYILWRDPAAGVDVAQNWYLSSRQNSSTTDHLSCRRFGISRCAFDCCSYQLGYDEPVAAAHGIASLDGKRQYDWKNSQISGCQL